MDTSRRAILGGAAALALAGKARAADFRALAPRPPMGWNSWDSFGAAITEAEAREQAQIMARVLRPHGYDVFTVDIQWYEPGATGFDYRKDAPLTLDPFGRLLPAPNRFPSARGGAGFAPLAREVHALGLKFGVHLMRGVPRLAVQRRLPVLGAPGITCADIANVADTCPWNGDMYGVDLTRPGAQAYYDSVFRLLAAWGVDYVKVDDIARPYFDRRPEIEAVRRAIDASGRPMVLSLSPGETPLAAADHVAAHANLWRISDDFWDRWDLLLAQFQRLADWAPHQRPGAWPDADMLPLGLIAQGKRRTNFTPREQKTLMTLWSIARSPLIMGGDLRALDPATAALLTNAEVLAANQTGREPRQVYRDGAAVAWASEARDGGRWLALFNIGDTPAQVRAPLRELGLRSPRVRDLWGRRDLGRRADGWAESLPAHGAAMYRLRA